MAEKAHQPFGAICYFDADGTGAIRVFAVPTRDKVEDLLCLVSHHLNGGMDQWTWGAIISGTAEEFIAEARKLFDAYERGEQSLDSLFLKTAELLREGFIGGMSEEELTDSVLIAGMEL